MPGGVIFFPFNFERNSHTVLLVPFLPSASYGFMLNIDHGDFILLIIGISIIELIYRYFSTIETLKDTNLFLESCNSIRSSFRVSIYSLSFSSSRFFYFFP